MKDLRKERRFAEAIGPVIDRVLSQFGLEEITRDSQVFKVWNSVVGPAISLHAQPSAIRKGKLTIKVDSSAWLSQLDRYLRSEIQAKLNQSLGRQLIKQIIFRIGEIEEADDETEKGQKGNGF